MCPILSASPPLIPRRANLNIMSNGQDTVKTRTLGWTNLASSASTCFLSLWMHFYHWTRDAHEILDAFWRAHLPQKVLKNKQAILELFSESHVLADLQDLKVHSSTQIHHNNSNMALLSWNLALHYVSQSSVYQFFTIIPQSTNKTLCWNSDQMVKAATDIVEIVEEILDINRQATKANFLLRANQWECAWAYHVMFHWFNIVGQQLALALVPQFQDDNRTTTDSSPLEMCASHILSYICTVMMGGNSMWT